MKDLLQTFAVSIFPRRVKNAIVDLSKRAVSERRKLSERELPQVSLERKHMQNCELLLDREEMLSKLGSGGQVAELGVAQGEFSKTIIEVASPDRLHLVDTWGSERYNSTLMKEVEAAFGNEIESGRVEIHRKRSTEAVEDFENHYFNWIYIDTDHSYRTTKSELHKYAPKVKNDGVIAGHDYRMGNWSQSIRYGVIESVHEFCVEHNWELVYLTVDPTEQRSFAIRRIRD